MLYLHTPAHSRARDTSASAITSASESAGASIVVLTG